MFTSIIIVVELDKMIENGSYIWKSKDVDMPVVVIGYLGFGPDNREYAKIEGSSCAIPIDELKKVLISKKPPLRRLF